jgi:hypothetical protein
VKYVYISPHRTRLSSVTESALLPPDLGTAPMAEYRAYFVGLDGHFIRYEPLVCDDDPEAITNAESLVDGHDVELWCGERMVVLLKRTQK